MWGLWISRVAFDERDASAAVGSTLFDNVGAILYDNLGQTLHAPVP